jgi:glycosyltransferase involved in cell wall biosynthesis
MSLGVCITTRHRSDLLRQCLEHIATSTALPQRVVVSDDSSKPDALSENEAVVGRFPWAVYVRGPQRGVCANRNHALARVGEVDYVAFLDDDALVSSDYFALALAAFEGLPPERRQRTIVSGVRLDSGGGRSRPCKLNFSGYFVPAAKTEVAGASYAVYPRSFFDRHQWDEQIYFGYEDAELSLRALGDGYEILHREDMELLDAGQNQSTFLSEGDRMNAYNFNGEAARLYVGVKRFKDIERSYAKLALFVPLFFGQISYSLLKRGSLGRLPELLKLSKVTSLV